MAHDVNERDLSWYEWALVTDGPRLAVRAALASLLSRRAITRTLNGYALTNHHDERAAPRDALETEIIRAAEGEPRVQVLIFRVSRGHAIQQLVRDLVRDGYLHALGHRATAAGWGALERRRMTAGLLLRQAPFDPGIYVALYGTDELPTLDADLAMQLGINITAVTWDISPGA